MGTLRWTEVWEFNGDRLELRALGAGEWLELVDPDLDKILRCFDDYEDARSWLLDKDFEIESRRAPDGRQLSTPAVREGA